MIKYLIFLLSLMFLFSSDSAQENSVPPIEFQIRNNAITGKVTLPSMSASQRSFRGRAYRNRGSSEVDDGDSNSSSDNFLMDTIISLHPLQGSSKAEPLNDPVTIKQINATFSPRVIPVTVGSTVQFVNDDPFYHNVFSLTPGARFNIGRRPTGDVYSKTIPATTWKVEGLGEIKLYCDIHAQMSAVILSLDTPYYVRVDKDGYYTLNDIPDGKYELRAYNPRFNLDNQEVVLGKNERSELNIDFSN